MADIPPAYASNPTATPQGQPQPAPYPQGQAQPTAYPQGPYPQQAAYPQAQTVTYPQGQAVAYPQGQAVAYPVGTYPQGQPVFYPQGQAVAYTPGQTVLISQPPAGTTQVVYQGSSGQDCCAGQSEQFKVAAGTCTGIFQLVLGILSIIIGAASYAFPTYHIGYGIWSGLMFFVPTGILGIVSKKQRTCVIIAYMVMCILCTFESLGMLAYEATAAGVLSVVNDCHFSYYNGYSDCYDTRLYGAVAIHAVLSVLGLIEFIVSIIAAAYCCSGLTCCCAKPPAATTQTVYQAQVPAQPMTVAAGNPAAQPALDGGKVFSKI